MTNLINRSKRPLTEEVPPPPMGHRGEGIQALCECLVILFFIGAVLMLSSRIVDIILGARIQ